MESITEQLAYVARRMFERRLTDMAGGNISAREGSRMYVSPRFSGSLKHWQLSPEDFIQCNVESDEILSDPRFSREGKAHLAVYRTFPDVGAIVHAHPFHVLPFCAAGRPIEPVLESTQKFGVVEVVKGAPAHSQDLADNIVAGLRGQEARVRKQAAAVLLPQHGILVAGKDLLAAIDALERIDWNAWCILAQGLMPKS
jgi:L-fuculose-phosphate aldolase